MGVGPTVRSARKISGGSRKYRKGVDHRKGGALLERGGVAKWCRAMIPNSIISLLVKQFESCRTEI